jgi:hypothetical protein
MGFAAPFLLIIFAVGCCGVWASVSIVVHHGVMAQAISAAFMAVISIPTSVWVMMKDLRRAMSKPSPDSTPKLRLSPNAEFLFFLFLDPKHCEAIVGDLEERHKLIHKKFGARKANFWYWTWAIRSVAPITWAWAKKLALKPVIGVISWAVARGFFSHDSWLAALVEIWKRIRS